MLHILQNGFNITKLFFLCITGFEDALKKREHEFRLQKDEMSAKVLEYELKVYEHVNYLIHFKCLLIIKFNCMLIYCNLLLLQFQAKLLAKELEIMKTAQAKECEQFNEVESSYRELEKKLKEKEWELTDVTSMKDARYLQF